MVLPLLADPQILQGPSLPPPMTQPPRQVILKLYFEQQNFVYQAQSWVGVQGAGETQAAQGEGGEMEAPSQSSAHRAVPVPRASPKVPLQNPRALQNPV